MVIMSVQNATQDLLWIARRFKGVTELIPQLEAFGSLENAINEAKAHLEKLGQEAGDLVVANAAAEQAVEASRKAADAILQEARDHASKIEAQAAVDAQKVRNEVTAVANAEVEKATDERKNIVKAIANRKNELSKVTEEVEAANRRLADIKAEIESLKAKF